MVTLTDLGDNIIGDTMVVNVTATLDGSALNLVGATSMLLTIKASLDDADVNALSQVTGSYVTDGSDGKIQFIVPASDTANAVSSTLYYYDVQVIVASGYKYTVNSGRVSFIDEVTLV